MKNPFKPRPAPLSLPMYKGGPLNEYHAYVVWSGGVDSTVALRHAIQTCRHVTAVSFNYGQLNYKEEEISQRWFIDAYQIEEVMHGRFNHVTLTIPTEFFPHNPLAGCNAPAVKYDTIEDVKHSNKILEVPFRNGMFISALAPRIAYTDEKKIPVVVTGCIEGGETISHPDTTPRFHKTASTFLSAALGRTVLASAPLLRCNKHDVVRYGSFVLGIELSMTRSCVRDTTNHCGECFPCQVRRKAFFLASIPDRTPYDAPWSFDDTDCKNFRESSKLPAAQKYNSKWD
jgi:7-cyano-7-deazaguanine synthase